MDRFKFRVWSKQSNSYIKEKMFYINEFGSLFKYEKSKSTVHINADSPYVMSLCGGYNYIIEQCTGLKDKNGKLIYEGDIVNTSGFDKCIIEWADNEAGFILKSIKTANYYSIYCLNGTEEIIGNVHENPELLEANND